MRANLSCFNNQMSGETFTERENTIEVLLFFGNNKTSFCLKSHYVKHRETESSTTPHELYVIPCREQIPTY